MGIETRTVFVDTAEEIVRSRWQENRQNKDRFDIPDDVFEEAITTFEKPTVDENVLVYKDTDDLDSWISQNL